MSLSPTQNISRSDLQILSDALDLYIAQSISPEQAIILKEKIRKTKDGDFDVCLLEALK